MKNAMAGRPPFPVSALVVSTAPDHCAEYIFGKSKNGARAHAVLFGLAMVVCSTMPQSAFAEMVFNNEPGTICLAVGDAYSGWGNSESCAVGSDAAAKVQDGQAYGNSLGKLSPGNNILVYGSTSRRKKDDNTRLLDSMSMGGNLDVWGGTGFHNGVDMNNTGIKNLADGTLSATSTDAVTGKQLNATNTRVTTVEGSVTTLQNTVSKISSSSTGLVQQSAAGKDITVAKDLDGNAVDFSGKNLSTSETFTRKLTGLADGALSASSADAVTGKQLYTTNQNLAETNKNLSANTTNISNLQNTVNNISSGSAGLVQQSAAGKDISVAKDLDGGVVDFTGKNLSTSEAFTRKLTGLADGALSATSTDAVTGKQLYTTNQNLTETNKNLAETNKNLSANTTNISNLQNAVNNISSGSAGLVRQSAAGKDITVAKDLDGGEVDFTGKNLSTSEAFTRKLTGLADGTLSASSTDAVTGKQLNTTNTRVTTAEGSITNLQNTVNNISKGST
ncbi:hemagglutinin, partial [Ralstonia solanacearum]|nr:hemagglutinin [Ralstonia solanacearum]